MSQNGPPWSRGDSNEPYTEPADPWGDQGAPPPNPAWGPPAYQPPPPSGSVWAPPAPPPPKRNTPMVALVVTLGLLIVVGLGTTAWLLKERNNKPAGQGEPTVAATTEHGPAPLGSEDARFAEKGDCVTNEGTDVKPKMRTSACASGTYKVLERITGPTTGEEDAEKKCAKVPGYTKWYFFDSQLDDLDFVLCLKEHKAV